MVKFVVDPRMINDCENLLHGFFPSFLEKKFKTAKHSRVLLSRFFSKCKNTSLFISKVFTWN